MFLVSVILSSALLLVLLLLNYTASRLQERFHQEELSLRSTAVLRWPSCALIVPVGGNDPRIRASLTSLLNQDYPDFQPVFVTETAHESASEIILSLKKDYPRLIHVVAGPSGLSGQKNHNLLSAVSAVQKLRPDCYVFCDSTHMADPLFLQYLLKPIALGETRFSTGYHEVCPQNSDLVPLGYAVSVFFMRVMQAISSFTQPWGGAMAITRKTFEDAEIARHWSNTVVDDCALVTHLAQRHIHVQLCTHALLKTSVTKYSMPTWLAWMERQILFPRFCVPLQWWLLGVFLLLLFIPPLLSLEDLVIALKGGMTSRALWPVVFFSLYFGLIFSLKRFFSKTLSPVRWLLAFFLALVTFFRVYLGTFGARRILWNRKLYTVGRGGVVLKKEELD